MKTLPAIATLTLNPALDTSYVTPALVADSKSLATESRFDPGGNGINVARGLQKLDHNVTACCILAGETGEFFARLLEARKVPTRVVQVAGDTRINCSIQQRRPPAEFKIGGVGPAVPAEALEDLRQQFLQAVSAEGHGIGVLSGSLPCGVSSDIYAELCEQLHARGARAVVDATGESLQLAVQARPFLLSPSRYELELLCGHTLETLDAMQTEARRLQDRGVENVCVSLGSGGALLVTPENSFYASAPKVHVLCTTGAGDALLAGLLAGLAENRSAAEALMLAVACGTATVMQPGTALFDPASLPDLMRQIECRELHA